MYKGRIKYYFSSFNRDLPYTPVLNRTINIFFGACLVAISLELFLVKNQFIDGGIVGVSILLSQLTNLNVSFLLIVLNTPFLLIGYQFLGKRFVSYSLFAIIVLSWGTFLLKPVPVVTNNPLLVILFGGMLLGMGVGIIIRFGGSLDGTEVLAILFSRRTKLSIGQIVLLANFFIFGSAIFVFGIREALYSIATFIVAYITIDLSVKEDV